MSHGPRVLIVDEVSDTEEVLRAVLEPRGLRIDRCSGRRFAQPLKDTETPSVLVIDTEAETLPGIQRETWEAVPQVLIGTTRLPAIEPTASAERHYLRKPFHYAELIQTIERIIAQDATVAAEPA